MKHLGGQATIVVGVAVILISLALGAMWEIERSTEFESERTARSDARLFTSEHVLLRLVDAETGVRGFVATRNRRFLDPYIAAKAALPQLEHALRSVHSSPQAAAPAITIARAAEAQIVLLDTVRADVEGGQTSVIPAALLRGKIGMDTIRSMVDAYQSTERRNDAARLVRAGADHEILRYVLAASFLLALAGGGLALFFFQTRIMGRLASVVAKTEDVAAGRALSPSLTGNDEIAAVDRAVARMATTIRGRNEDLARYRLLAEVTHDVILFIDRTDLTIVDANAAALESYGYERADLIGKPTAILHAIDDPIDIQAIAQSDTPAGLSYEGMHQRADGVVFPVEVHARSADVNGRLTIIKTIRDISERRRAAEQVSLALDHAIEASRLKSEFVATMSHEIRTPMHGVIGMSELLMKTPLLPVQREYATTVKESGQALLAIIDDILDFSKLEAHKMKLESVAFDPIELVASTIRLVSAAARDKGLIVRSNVSSLVPAAVRGDPIRVRQVLINLIGNAVKFTPAGEVVVSTTVERDDGRTVILAFAVSDTGIGVLPEARQQLFDPFVQGDGSTTRRFGGSGLGLSISRRLVELMNGRIWLENRQGPGSTFCFTARFERTAEVVGVALSDIEHARQARLTPADGRPGQARILLADDSALIRRVARFQLDELAHRVDMVENGLEAVEAIANGDYDLVLMDVRMPDVDGLAATRMIRAAERNSGRHIVVVALTANVLEGDREACIEAGMDDFLAKPLRLETLHAVLDRWLPVSA
jgi:PAS domain S-box-containing protein